MEILVFWDFLNRFWHYKFILKLGFNTFFYLLQFVSLTLLIPFLGPQVKQLSSLQTLQILWFYCLNFSIPSLKFLSFTSFKSITSRVKLASSMVPFSKLSGFDGMLVSFGLLFVCQLIAEIRLWLQKLALTY